jgi:phage pi2 protein 07
MKIADIDKQGLTSWNEYVKEYGCKHYQPKLPEDSVVLSREEYKQLLDNAIRVDVEYLYNELAKASKETAEKILFDLVGHTFECDGWTYTVDVDDVKWLADKYKVEIKE